MKILLEGKHTLHTGKGKFALRLEKALRELGATVTMYPESFKSYDVVLGLGKFLSKYKTKKKILRLGAVHFAKGHEKPNARKIKALREADGVVYQSEFSKKICNAFMEKARCPTKIIYNGAHPGEFYNIFKKLPFKYNFLASTRVWTKQKRLKHIKKAFLQAEIKNSCLWICGTCGRKQGDDYYKSTEQIVKYTGQVDKNMLASLYKQCNALINITHLDACPNSVVECLNAALPVICSNEGGTREIVKDNGIIVDIDPPYNFKTVKILPKEFNIKTLSKAIRDIICVKIKPPDYLHIDEIARQYLTFFEEVLNG